ncbi:esterase family protein, partial [Clostridioides difficile]
HMDRNASSALQQTELQRIFGPEVTGTENDLIHLLKESQSSESPRPLLYQCCGTEDFLYEDNQTFRQACEQTNFELTYEEGPGEHEWGY